MTMKGITVVKTVSLLLVFFLLFGAGVACAQRLAVSADVANIRSGPGTKYDILWKVEKYHPIEVIKKTGKWYYFRDFERDLGWVHQSLVAKIPAVITVMATCNVRSGSGTKNDIVFTVGKGIPFKVLRRKGHWIQVEHADGDGGWIYKTLVW